MPKAQDYHLTDKELQQIEKAIKHDKRAEVVQRSIAIRLLHLGNKPEKVAEMQAVSKPTIYGWFHRWQDGGVEALANRPKSGRPLKANDEYSLALEAIIGECQISWANEIHNVSSIIRKTLLVKLPAIEGKNK